MMQYKYRWLYALVLSLVTIGLGFFYDLEKKWLRLAELKQSEQEIIKKLNDKTPFKQHKNNIHFVSLPPLKANEFTTVSNIVKLAHSSDLSIQAIKSVKSVSAHLTLQLVVEGYFAQISAFICVLEAQQGVKIEHFSLRLSKHHLMRMQAELWLPLSSLQQVIPANEPQAISLTTNPFCASISMNKELFHYSVNKLQSFPVRLLKMVGYLKQGQQVAALLLLPNHDLVAINQGSIVGKERASVIAIQPDQVQVKWQDKKQIIFLKAP